MSGWVGLINPGKLNDSGKKSKKTTPSVSKLKNGLDDQNQICYKILLLFTFIDIF